MRLHRTPLVSSDSASAPRILIVCAAAVLGVSWTVCCVRNELGHEELADEDSVTELSVEDSVTKLSDSVTEVHVDTTQSETHILTGSGMSQDIEEAKESSEVSISIAPRCRPSAYSSVWSTFGEAPNMKLTHYALTYTITCTADASAKIFFSGKMADQSKAVDGMGGIYQNYTLKQGDNKLDPLELGNIDRAFGLVQGLQWIHVEAWNDIGERKISQAFATIKALEGVNGYLWFAGGNHKDGCKVNRWKFYRTFNHDNQLTQLKLSPKIVCPKDSHVAMFLSSPLQDLGDPITDVGVPGTWIEADVKAEEETFLDKVDLFAISSSQHPRYGSEALPMWIQIQAIVDGTALYTNQYISVKPQVFEQA